MDDKASFEKGTYGFVKDSKVYFNPATNNAVIIDKSELAITSWQRCARQHALMQT